MVAVSHCPPLRCLGIERRQAVRCVVVIVWVQHDAIHVGLVRLVNEDDQMDHHAMTGQRLDRMV